MSIGIVQEWQNTEMKCNLHQSANKKYLTTSIYTCYNCKFISYNKLMAEKLEEWKMFKLVYVFLVLPVAP